MDMKDLYKKDIYDEYELSDFLEVDALLDNPYKNMQYSFGKGVLKSVINVVLFAIPVLLASNPAWLDLTLGGVLVLIVNFLKIKYRSV